MTRTELLTHLITDQIENRRFVDVDTFRDMYVNGLPGKLALLAISRDGERILPVFENDYFHTELVDYTKVSETLGKDWVPLTKDSAEPAGDLSRPFVPANGAHRAKDVFDTRLYQDGKVEVLRLDGIPGDDHARR